MKVREDKDILSASTSEFLANMYWNQQGHGDEFRGVDDGELLDVSIEPSDIEEYESGSEGQRTSSQEP